MDTECGCAHDGKEDSTLHCNTYTPPSETSPHSKILEPSSAVKLFNLLMKFKLFFNKKQNM